MGKVLDQYKQFDIVDDFSGHHYSRMEYFSDGEGDFSNLQIMFMFVV